MQGELENRCIYELSSCIYDHLHPNPEDAIYPPDEYDAEARLLLEQLANHDSSRQPSSLLRVIFEETLEYKPDQGAFEGIDQAIGRIIKKYSAINSNT